MASSFLLEARHKRQRVKKMAKPTTARITAAQVVDRLYDRFPMDMARLAE